MNQREVVEGVARLGVECGRRHEGPSGLAEAAQFEEDLPLEGPVDRNFTRRLQAAPDQEKGALEIVEIKNRLGLQVMNLGLRGAIEAREGGVTGQEFVRESDRLLELAEVLHEELDPIQVCGRKLGIGAQRA